MDNQIVDLIITKGPWVLSFLAIFQTYLQGEKLAAAWIVTGFSQLCWYLWIYLSGNTGFVVLTTFLLILSVRNYFKWRHDDERRTHGFGRPPIDPLPQRDDMWMPVNYEDDRIPWYTEVRLMDENGKILSHNIVLLRHNYSPEKPAKMHFYRVT